MEVVSTVPEWSELYSIDELRKCPAMCIGNDCVAISPADGDGWEFGQLVSSLKERTRLPTPIDHVPHRSGERTRRSRPTVHRTKVNRILFRESRVTTMQRNASSKPHEALAESFDHVGHRS